MAKIILRFDDICPTMNWKQWDKAKALLDSVGATALLGVIPDNQDSDLMIDKPNETFWKYVKQLQDQGYTIAMHGYQHVFDINADGIVTKKHKTMNHSEFAGHPYDIQYKKIKAGRDILIQHDIETDVFFAPAHAYDDNTLKALAANNFKYISDGKSNKPYKRNGIICIPAKSGGIPKISRKGYFTVVLHAHEWTRDDKRIAWQKLQLLCDEWRDSIITFRDFVNRPVGNYLYQRITEVLYLYWEFIIKPHLVFIKHRFLK